MTAYEANLLKGNDMRTLMIFATCILFIVSGLPGCQASHISPKSALDIASADHHGWIGTEVVKTPYGDFDFKNGYPTPTAADALLDQLQFNRAIDVYMTERMVSDLPLLRPVAAAL
jgi:hypothetical protein